MKHLLFNFAAAISGLLLLAILLLWPRSYFHHDLLSYVTPTGAGAGISSSSGRVSAFAGPCIDILPGVSWLASDQILAETWAEWSYADRSNADFDIRTSRFLGCEFSTPIPGGLAFRSPTFLYIPYSYLAILASFTPTFWILQTRYRRSRSYRRAHHLCPTCGYDLRAHLSTHSSSLPRRCPECGTPIATPSVPT